MHPRRTAILAAVVLATVAAGDAFAQTPTEFYKDKQVTFYVGLSPGGGYDLNARLVARYIGRYIPGQPQVIVKNMPGVGGLLMTNFVANVSAKDGLHIGAPQRGVPFEPLLGDASHAKFDPTNLQWIGSANADTSVAVATRRSGVKTWQDLKTRELIVAGTGVGTESVTVPYVLRNVLGLKFKVIAGFPGGSEMNLAMLRGEVDGRGTFTWTSLKPNYKEWVEGGEIVILFQQGLRKHPDMPNVTLVTELAETEVQKRLLELQFTAFELGRPYFVAEGVPADRVTALRRAFDQAMKDKESDRGCRQAGARGQSGDRRGHAADPHPHLRHHEGAGGAACRGQQVAAGSEGAEQVTRGGAAASTGSVWISRSSWPGHSASKTRVNALSSRSSTSSLR
jgi:tripartite-type tricarboxylate transporter receptor subunit TctC